MMSLLNRLEGQSRDPISYSDLVKRYGGPMAFDLLLSIEKLANIRDNIIYLDEDTRLQLALEVLNRCDPQVDVKKEFGNVVTK